VTIVLTKFEAAWHILSQKVLSDPALTTNNNSANSSSASSSSSVYFHEPLPDLKECLVAIDETLKVNSGWAMVGNTKGQAAAAFISIEASFSDPQSLQRYRSAVGRPVGFGNVIGGVVEATYQVGVVVVESARCC
jgi:hypothetical protein